MSFVTDIRKVVLDTAKRLTDQDTAIERLKSSENTIYTQEYIDTKMREAVDLRDEIQRSGESAIDALVLQYLESVRDIDVPNGEELTGDARLLSAEYELTAHELEVIFDRHEGNRTMQQLVLRFAQKHRIHLDRTFITALDKENAAKEFRNAARGALGLGYNYEIFKDDTAFEQAVPEALRGE